MLEIPCQLPSGPLPVLPKHQLQEWADQHLFIGDVAVEVLCRNLFKEATINQIKGLPTGFPTPTSPINCKPKTQIFVKCPIKAGQNGFTGSMGNADSLKALLDDCQQVYTDHKTRVHCLIGDEQTFEALWKVKTTHPHYDWVLPLPGLWHLQYNLQQALCILFGDWLLSPVALQTGRPASLFRELGNGSKFRPMDLFLHQLADAGLTYINQMLSAAEATGINNLMFKVANNQNLYEFLFIFTKCLMPYIALRQAIRAADWPRITALLPIILHIFICSKKMKYAKLTCQLLLTLTTLPANWLSAVQGVLISRMSATGVGVGTDMLIEFVHLHIKSQLPVGHRTWEGICTAFIRLNIMLPLLDNMESIWHGTEPPTTPQLVEEEAAQEEDEELQAVPSAVPLPVVVPHQSAIQQLGCSDVLSILQQLFGYGWTKNMTMHSDFCPLLPDVHG